MRNAPYISVIIPSYNEAENIQRGVLKDVYKFLSKKKFTWEVIISDDGSSDASYLLAKKEVRKLKGFSVLENNHEGKPSALWYGIQKSRGVYVLFTDMDQSTPIDQLEKLLPKVDEGFDVVIGSRGMSRKNFPLYRRLGAAVFISIRKSLMLSDIDDTQCGFKLFDRRVLMKTFPKLEFFETLGKKVKGWKVTSFDVELLHIIKKLGYKVAEVRVKWEGTDKSTAKGNALQRYLKESYEMFLQILRVKLNDIKGLYEG